MSAMSNYLETALINAVFGNTAYAPPAAVYAALFTSDPTDAASGSEVLEASYARQLVTFVPSVGGATGNSDLVTFGPAEATWGSITHFAVFDALSGGNMLVHGTLTLPKTVLLGGLLVFSVDSLRIVFQ